MACDHLPSAQCHTCLYLLFPLSRPGARLGAEPILEQNSLSCIPHSIHQGEINVDFCTLPHCDSLIRHIFQRNNAIRGLVPQVHLKKRICKHWNPIFYVLNHWVSFWGFPLPLVVSLSMKSKQISNSILDGPYYPLKENKPPSIWLK